MAVPDRGAVCTLCEYESRNVDFTVTGKLTPSFGLNSDLLSALMKLGLHTTVPSERVRSGSVASPPQSSSGTRRSSSDLGLSGSYGSSVRKSALRLSGTLNTKPGIRGKSPSGSK